MQSLQVQQPQQLRQCRGGLERRRCTIARAGPAAAASVAGHQQQPQPPQQLQQNQQQPSQQQKQQHGDPAPGLRLFIDSADVAQWRRWAPTGTLWGATTNPAILEKDRVPCTLEAAAGLAREAAALGLRELQLQAWGGSAAALLASALALQDLRQEHCPGVLLTIKLPCTAEGLEAAAGLRKALPESSITVTGVYAAHQALLARAVGADYVAPYLGRMGDTMGPEKALAEVADMHAAMAATAAPGAPHPPTRVLVASIRSASLMARLAAAGCDTFTFAPSIMEEIAGLPATLAAAADFEAAAARNR